MAELPYFDVTKCLPFDIMRTLFEGVVPLVLNHLFKHLVDGGYVTLNCINECVAHFSNGSSKPAVIYRDAAAGSNFHFKQKGILLFL